MITATLTDAAKRLARTATDNSPAILSATAVAGVISTAVLTGRASVKAADVIRDAEELRKEYEELAPDRLPNKERLELVWKLYIPPVLTAAATVGCIIGSNHISSRRNAALLSVYSLTETAFKEYKDKVVETIGEKKEQAVRDSIANDQIAANPPSSNEVIIMSGSDVLCYETWIGRYFRSDYEALRKIENDLNHTILHDNYVSLNDFYREVGISTVEHGEEVGWNLDNKVDFYFSSVLTDDKKPVLSVSFSNPPKPGYYKVY